MPMNKDFVVYGLMGTRSASITSRSCSSMEKMNMDPAEEFTRRSR